MHTAAAVPAVATIQRRMAGVPLERLGEELRALRRRLVAYEQTTREEWAVELDTYDHGLQEAADMLEVGAPVPGPDGSLTPEQRADLENDLASAGFDVRSIDV